MQNKNDKKKKIIGIDARFYGPIGKGLGRYTQEIVDRLINGRLAQSYDFVIFLSPENYSRFECPHPGVKKVLVKARWYGLAEQWQLPLYWRREKVDLMHFPHFNVPFFKPGPFVVTIHDLILTKFPSRRATTLSPLKYWLKDKAYRITIRSAIKSSRRIITVSNFTKNDIVKHFPVDPDKVTVTYEGVASLSRWTGLNNNPESGRRIIARYGIREPFLLYIGNAYPHKNLDGFLDSFKYFSESHPGISLVMVGKDDYFYSRVRQHAEALGLSGDGKPKVVFPGYVPDADLEQLYRSAEAYAFPSLYEGFGLPPLEAMARRCPVVSSDRASMPEILGDAALYFDPEDSEDTAKKLAMITSDQELRRQLADKGEARAQQYSWERCAEQTAEIYEEALAR